MPQLNEINKAADHRLRQTLMFSATLDHAEVNELAMSLLKIATPGLCGGFLSRNTKILSSVVISADHLSHKEALLSLFVKAGTN